MHTLRVDQLIARCTRLYIETILLSSRRNLTEASEVANPRFPHAYITSCIGADFDQLNDGNVGLFHQVAGACSYAVRMNRFIAARGNLFIEEGERIESRS